MNKLIWSPYKICHLKTNCILRNPLNYTYNLKESDLFKPEKLIGAPFLEYDLQIPIKMLMHISFGPKTPLLEI